MKQSTLERMQDKHRLPWASIETINKFIDCKQQDKIQKYKQILNSSMR